MRDVLQNLAKLPERCHAILNQEVVLIRRGARSPLRTPVIPKDQVEILNTRAGITPAQVKAMVVGATLGWDMDGADPDTQTDEPEEKIGDGPFTYEYDGTIDVVITVEAMSEQLAMEAARDKLRSYLSADLDWPCVSVGSDLNDLYLLESTDPREQ